MVHTLPIDSNHRYLLEQYLSIYQYYLSNLPVNYQYLPVTIITDALSSTHQTRSTRYHQPSLFIQVPPSHPFMRSPAFCRGFTAFDIATQSLVASYMGRHDLQQAKEVLVRVLQLGVSVGSVLALVMVAGAPWAPAVFTSDPQIISLAQRVFPLLGVILVSWSLPVVHRRCRLSPQCTYGGEIIDTSACGVSVLCPTDSFRLLHYDAEVQCGKML